MNNIQQCILSQQPEHHQAIKADNNYATESFKYCQEGGLKMQIYEFRDICSYWRRNNCISWRRSTGCVRKTRGNKFLGVNRRPFLRNKRMHDGPTGSSLIPYLKYSTRWNTDNEKRRKCFQFPEAIQRITGSRLNFVATDFLNIHSQVARSVHQPLCQKPKLITDII